MKKHYYLILAVLCSAILFSCKEPEPVVENKETSLKVEPALVKFTSAAGSSSVNLATESEAWEVFIKDAAWLKVSPETGNGNAEIAFTVEKNDGARRSAVVTFSAENAKDVQVTVIQEKGEAPVEKTGLYAEPEKPNADQPCTLYYKADKNSPFFDKSGDLYAHIGINEWSNVQSNWGENIAKCKFEKTETPNLWKLEIEPSVREWFGAKDEEVFRICVVVRNAEATAQTADLFLAVEDSKNAFTPDAVVEESLPSGVKHGINYNADGSVTFVFYEKDKKNNRYDWYYLIGEFLPLRQSPCRV